MAFSVTYSFRIIFSFEKDDEVVFYEIGDHDIYDCNTQAKMSSPPK